MKVPIRARGSSADFNLTPLIDVVFNLVIFFLVASHFARSEPLEEVTLPSATQTTVDDTPRRLTITIQPAGTYSVAAKAVSLSDVERLLAEGAGDDPESFAVRIRGDRTAPYRWIEPLMLACARQGIRNFGFKVIAASDTH